MNFNSAYGHYAKILLDQQRIETYELHKNQVPKIKNVIFNNPYTIVFWQDGTKTTVTCGENDVWDEEKGIALAVAKKVYGNKGSYIDNIKPFLTENVEKEKARVVEEKKKLESKAKALEEKIRQRHIKKIAKKQLRLERLVREVKIAKAELKKKEINSLSDTISRAADSVDEVGKIV